MRNHFDNFNLGLMTAFWSSVMAGWTVSEWAAAAALLYSLMLITQKLWQFGRWLRTRGR